MHKTLILIAAAALPYTGIMADNLKKDPKELLDSQIAVVDDLISMTQQTLKAEQEIRTLIAEYQQIQEVYLKNTDDKEQSARMVRMAHRVLTKIQENHLTAQFDPDFISELSLFSKIAAKKGIPKP